MNRFISDILLRQWRRIRGFGWNEVALLLAALLILVCVYSVIELADEVKEGATQTVDEWILRSLRRVDDWAVPIGPGWMREAGLDLTALGSPVVLILTTGAVMGFLFLQRLSTYHFLHRLTSSCPRCRCRRSLKRRLMHFDCWEVSVDVGF
jgi:hypothetical protein